MQTILLSVSLVAFFPWLCGVHGKALSHLPRVAIPQHVQTNPAFKPVPFSATVAPGKRPVPPPSRGAILIPTVFPMAKAGLIPTVFPAGKLVYAGNDSEPASARAGVCSGTASANKK